MTDIELALVAAIAENGVIGDGEKLPWHLPADLARFRKLTWGKPLIMGRKTFQSIGHALPGRETIVVTRNPRFATPAVMVVHAIDVALDLGRERANALGVSEVMVCGGGALYAAAIGLAERLYLTFVETSPPEGVRFPPVDWTQWRETARGMPMPAQDGQPGFVFADFRRR